MYTTQRKKAEKIYKQNLSDEWDKNKKSNIHFTGVPGEKREQCRKNLKKL